MRNKITFFLSVLCLNVVMETAYSSAHLEVCPKKVSFDAKALETPDSKELSPAYLEIKHNTGAAKRQRDLAHCAQSLQERKNALKILNIRYKQWMGEPLSTEEKMFVLLYRPAVLVEAVKKSPYTDFPFNRLAPAPLPVVLARIGEETSSDDEYDRYGNLKADLLTDLQDSSSDFDTTSSEGSSTDFLDSPHEEMSPPVKRSRRLGGTDFALPVQNPLLESVSADEDGNLLF